MEKHRTESSKQKFYFLRIIETKASSPQKKKKNYKIFTILDASAVSIFPSSLAN